MLLDQLNSPQKIFVVLRPSHHHFLAFLNNSGGNSTQQSLDTLVPLLSPLGDMPQNKAEQPSMILDAVNAHCPYARLWSPSEDGFGLYSALDWATGLFGGDGPVALAGSSLTRGRIWLILDYTDVHSYLWEVVWSKPDTYTRVLGSEGRFRIGKGSGQKLPRDDPTGAYMSSPSR